MISPMSRRSLARTIPITKVSASVLPRRSSRNLATVVEAVEKVTDLALLRVYMECP